MEKCMCLGCTQSMYKHVYQNNLYDYKHIKSGNIGINWMHGGAAEKNRSKRETSPIQ